MIRPIPGMSPASPVAALSSGADLVRDLAARALDDCIAEQQAARDAMVRAEAHLDKHHELMALAKRFEALG